MVSHKLLKGILILPILLIVWLAYTKSPKLVYAQCQTGYCNEHADPCDQCQAGQTKTCDNGAEVGCEIDGNKVCCNSPGGCSDGHVWWNVWKGCPSCGPAGDALIQGPICTTNTKPTWSWLPYSNIKDPKCNDDFTVHVFRSWDTTNPEITSSTSSLSPYTADRNLIDGTYLVEVWYTNEYGSAGPKSTISTTVDTIIPLPSKPKISPVCSGDGGGMTWYWTGANESCGVITKTDLQKVGGPGSTWLPPDPERVDVDWMEGLQTEWSAGAARYNGDYVRVRFRETVEGVERKGAWIDGEKVNVDSVRPTITSGSIDPSDCVITSDGSATWNWSNPSNAGCFPLIIRTDIDLAGNWGSGDGNPDKSYAGTKTSFWSKEASPTLKNGDYIRVRYVEGDGLGQEWVGPWYDLPKAKVCDYKVTLTPESATITAGDTYRFKAEVTPDPIWPYKVDVGCATARVSSPSPGLPSCRWLDMSGNPFVSLGIDIPFTYQVEVYNTAGWEGHMLAIASAESKGLTRKDSSDLYINKASGDNYPTCSFTPAYQEKVEDFGIEDFMDFVLNIKDNVPDVDYVISTSAGRIVQPSPPSGTVFSTDANVNVRWGQDTVITPALGIVLTAQITDSLGQKSSCSATLDLLEPEAYLEPDWEIAIAGESTCVNPGNNMNFSVRVRDTIGDWKYPVDLYCYINPYTGAIGSPKCTPVSTSVGEPSNSNFVSYVISNTSGAEGVWDIEVRGYSDASTRSDYFTFKIPCDTPPSGDEDFYIDLFPDVVSAKSGFDYTFQGKVGEIGDYTDPVNLTCNIVRTEGTGATPTCQVVASVVPEVTTPVVIKNTSGITGKFTVTLTGTSNSKTRADSSTLELYSLGDYGFRLSVYPGESFINQGDDSIFGFHINATGFEGFKDDITLSFEPLDAYNVYAWFRDDDNTLNWNSSRNDYAYEYIDFVAGDAGLTDEDGLKLRVSGVSGPYKDETYHRIYITDDPECPAETPVLTPGQVTHRTAEVSWSFPGGYKPSPYVIFSYASCDPNIEGSEYMGIRCPTPAETGIGWSELRDYGWTVYCTKYVGVGFGPVPISKTVLRNGVDGVNPADCEGGSVKNFPIGKPLGSKLLVRAATEHNFECKSPYSPPLEIDMYPDLEIVAMPRSPTVQWVITGPDMSGYYSLDVMKEFVYTANNVPPKLLDTFLWTVPGGMHAGGNYSFDPPYTSSSNSNSPTTKLIYTFHLETTDYSSIDIITDDFTVQAEDLETSVSDSNSITMVNPANTLATIRADVRQYNLGDDGMCDYSSVVNTLSGQTIIVTNENTGDFYEKETSGTPPFAYYDDLKASDDHTVEYLIGGDYESCNPAGETVLVTTEELMLDNHNVEVNFAVFLRPDESFITANQGNTSIVSGYSSVMPDDKNLVDANGSALAYGRFADTVNFGADHVYVYEEPYEENNVLIEAIRNKVRDMSDGAIEGNINNVLLKEDATIVDNSTLQLSSGGTVNIDTKELIIIANGNFTVNAGVTQVNPLFVVLRIDNPSKGNVFFIENLIDPIVFNQELIVEGEIDNTRLKGIEVKGPRKLFNSSSNSLDFITDKKIHWIRID